MDLPIHLPPSLTLLAVALAVVTGLLAHRQPIAMAWAMWRHKRRWPLSSQVYHLRVALQADHRWLAADRTADALTSRYLAMLGDDWMSVSHEDTAQLRERLQLNPYSADHKIRRALVLLTEAGAENIRFDYPETTATGYPVNPPARAFPTSFSVLVADAQRRAAEAKSNNENEETAS